MPTDASLGGLVAGVRRPSSADPAAVAAHLDRLTKPPGSLGVLETLARRLAVIYGDPPPPLRRRLVIVCAGDHGVAARGVSAYPAAVTAAMCRNIAAGGAAINAIATAVGAAVVVADVGVDAPLEDVPGLQHCKVRRGTADLVDGPAMTEGEALRAIGAGGRLVLHRVDDTDIVALGEMGIGNTTAAAALTASLTGAPAHACVGCGTGLDAAALSRKRELVTRAVGRAGASTPLEALTRLGGLEIAALVGVTLAAAAAGRAVVTDGFIATAAAYVAVRLCPPVRDYLFAAHRSVEPGHGVLLRALDLDPILDLDLRLGEGTGAALALPILDAAGAILRDMATFEEAAVPGAPAEAARPEPPCA